MKARDGTAPVLGRLYVLASITVVAIALGSVSLAAQNPPSPAADTTALLIVRDTNAVANVPAAVDDLEEGYRRMSLVEYGNRVVGPRALARDIATAGFSQARGRPVEWSKDWHGYGNRVSSRLGTAVIAQTIVLGVSVLRDERPAHFTLCDCTGTVARLGHALLVPMTMETPEGRRLSLLAPASEIVSAILITSLFPGGLAIRAGLGTGAVGVAASALGAVGREFWPFHRRPFGI